MTGVAQNDRIQARACARPGTELFEVGRETSTMVYVYSCTGENGEFDSEANYTIGSGCDADSLWAFSSAVDCQGESASVRADLHKQFATITLSVSGYDKQDGYPYTLEVSGEIIGMDIRTLDPLPGDFRFIPKDNGAGTFRFRLPRQNQDSGLSITVEDADGSEEFPLDKWIRLAGYDWTEPDLKDIDMVLDYAKASVSVNVSGWEDGGTVTVEI